MRMAHILKPCVLYIWSLLVVSAVTSPRKKYFPPLGHSRVGRRIRSSLVCETTQLPGTVFVYRLSSWGLGPDCYLLCPRPLPFA